MNDALNNWIKLVSEHGVDQVVNLYAEDGVLLGTFSDEIRQGKDKIREYFQFFLNKKPYATIVDYKKHIVDENNYSVNGFYDFEVDTKDGSRQVSKARFTFVFQKQGSSFKILSHHSSLIP
ncbi:MAG: hypothetical protein CMP49_00010 [Flavobacteriales bacterium]|jgi:uncharacterized protein (TIGR02246 family)|nr:hypothetical protein [Flavobacteriales bacterium]|tara:strand:+ start:7034 stop:7396 length:363 start_codon:yes stop_codon:yes gene_type:complete